MAIDSVTSSVSLNTQTPQSVRSQPQPDQAELARKAAEDKARTPEPKQAETPRPVVNAQGQTTGKIINVTA